MLSPRSIPAIAAALLFSCLQPAAAQGIRSYVTPDGFRTFQLCRAAVFFHLDRGEAGADRFPISSARVLREQLDFQMQETIYRSIPDTLDRGHEVIRFTEDFFIKFAEMLQQQGSTLADTAKREKILFDCVPFVWVGMSSQITYLLKWRAAAMRAPAQPDPAAELKWMDMKGQELTR